MNVPAGKGREEGVVIYPGGGGVTSPPPHTDNWAEKAKRRHTTGTGRMRHLKNVHRRFKNGFREGSQAVSKKKRSDKKQEKQT